RRAIPFGQERLDREASASSPGAGGLVTERRLADNLLRDQHLEVNAEPSLVGEAVRAMGHGAQERARHHLVMSMGHTPRSKDWRRGWSRASHAPCGAIINWDRSGRSK